MSEEPIAKDFGEGWYEGLRQYMTTVPMGEEATAEAKGLVLEYEAGRLLGSAVKIVERLERFKPQHGSSLEVRLALLRAYIDVERMDEVECAEYEGKVDVFLNLTKSKVDRLESATLRSAYGFIELEANVMAAIQAFYYDEDGYAETNVDEGRKRFREVVKRRVQTLKLSANDQYLSEKQARLAFMDITRTVQEVSHFCQEFPRAHFLGCCAQFIVEIQERLFGPPHLSGQLIDAATIETLAIKHKVANFGALASKSLAIAPTPARQLSRATKELQEAAGLSVSKPKRSRTDVEAEEDGHTVARRSLIAAATAASPSAASKAPAAAAAPVPRTPTAAVNGGKTAAISASKAPVSALKAPVSASKAPVSASKPAQPAVAKATSTSSPIATSSKASPAAPQSIMRPAPTSASKGAAPRRVGFLPETQGESQQEGDAAVGQTQPMPSSQEGRSPGKRVKFTGEEDNAIREGVAKYGAGQWSSILGDPDFGRVLRANGRTNVNIKDRWRNIKNNNQSQA